MSNDTGNGNGWEKRAKPALIVCMLLAIVSLVYFRVCRFLKPSVTPNSHKFLKVFTCC